MMPKKQPEENWSTDIHNTEWKNEVGIKRKKIQKLFNDIVPN